MSVSVDEAGVRGTQIVSPVQDRLREFERRRPKLFGIAYRMLGSRADAEDVLQDAYLRWHRGAPDELRSPRRGS